MRLIASSNRHLHAGIGDPPSGKSDFESFYEEQLEWAARLAFLLTAQVQVAEEIAQEAFLELHRRFDTLSNPRGYLRVTVVNLCRRQRRRESQQRRAYSLIATPSSVNAEAQELLDVIDKLPIRQRAVIVLRYFEGMTESEIAQVLSCRPGTVKSLAARALARLRKEVPS